MAIDETADEVYQRQLSRLFMEVRSLAVCNRAYYKGAPGIANERFYGAFSQLLDHLDNGLVLGVNTIFSFAPHFDFDKAHPGNGYRSMITVIQKCCLRIMTLARYVTVNRESYLFRANHYSKELEAFVTTLGQLRACLYYLQKLVQYCDKGELFPDENALLPEQYQVAERLLQEVEYLNQESFYGRCLGFQFCESMLCPLTVINVAMASYGEGYQKTKFSVLRLANSLLSCGKYLLNPELRAKQVINMTRTSDIYFCKSFWSLPENSVMHNVPLYMCPSMEVSKIVTIEPIPFELPLADGSGSIVISPPSAHTGVGPVMARLISSEYRCGQEVWFSHYGLRLPSLKTPLQKSPCLLIHCHGGGFVAQSSASHQMYLNHWARDLGIPILSIDYTLAPESHFPRQHEELFFAYRWALKNCHSLGSLAEKICIVGDSAGANMAVSVAMRVASCGLRQPDAVVSIYGGLVIKYSPSPSRILSLMDPLLPLGVVALCLRAYTGDAKDFDAGCQNVDETEDQMSIAAANELEQDKLKLQGQHSHSGTLNVKLSINNNFADSKATLKAFSDCADSSEQIISKPVPVEQGSASGRSSHRREDSGFFDISEQQEMGSSTNSQIDLKRSDKTSCTFSKSLSEPHSRSDFGSYSGFAVKESSDEESDSLPSSVGFALSSDEQSGQELNVEENDISSTHHSPSFSACRSISDCPGHMRQTVSSPQCLSDMHTSLPFLLPPPDSSSPLMSSYAKLCHFAESPMENSKDIKNARNPYVSPPLASDDLLRKLCPVYVLACDLDPLLDDSIMFARRLRSLEKTVHLEIIPDVPHGFLNFVLVSPEAKAASGCCVHAIKKMLDLDD